MGRDLNDPVAFLIIALAAWRLAVLLVAERGPFDAALRLREMAGIVHDDEGEPVGIPETTIARALACVWCSSVWTAMLTVAAWVYAPVVVVVLAAAGVAAIVQVTVDRLRR